MRVGALPAALAAQHGHGAAQARPEGTCLHPKPRHRHSRPGRVPGIGPVPRAWDFSGLSLAGCLDFNLDL